MKIVVVLAVIVAIVSSLTYEIVDTGQTNCYGSSDGMTCPYANASSPYFGQDGNYLINPPSYRDNGDGTIDDLVTGLMWVKDPGSKVTYPNIDAAACAVGGHNDWRLPSIKEMYSLIMFSGVDSMDPTIPFINTEYFDFQYGDESIGERLIDSQFATSSIYVGTTMGGNPTMFGVNFADGRIKGYPHTNGKTFFVMYVRGNSEYGVNQFVNNNNGTITDSATGLMWTQQDSEAAMNWEDALGYAIEKNNENYLGYSDWRLPHVKELESIVDYTKSPQVGGLPAIDTTFFNITPITAENGANYPWFWSGTTHAQTMPPEGRQGAYVCFGEALGYWQNVWQDVHGAGAQRSDPKEGDPAEYPEGFGPQGDAIRIFNYVRLVRGGNPTVVEGTEFVPSSSLGRQFSVISFILLVGLYLTW